MTGTSEETVVDKEAPDYYKDALLALTFYRSCSSNVEKEMELIRNSVSEKLRDKAYEKECGSLFREHLWCSFIAIGLITFMQLGGGPVVDCQSTNIFKSAGFGDTTSSGLSTAYGIVKI